MELDIMVMMVSVGDNSHGGDVDGGTYHHDDDLYYMIPSANIKFFICHKRS